MTNYGLPYTGSKNTIAEKIIKHFPEADTLVDVFFGGGAITHCAIVNNKFKNYIANDIRTTPQFFVECLKGKYSNDLRWISLEDFKNSPRDDWFVRLLWSFSNICNTYMYSKKIEPYKKALHYAVCFNDFSLIKEIYGSEFANKLETELITIPIEQWNYRRLKAQQFISKQIKEHLYNNDNNPLQNLNGIARLQNLERLNRIKDISNSINNTFNADTIKIYNLDYKLLNEYIPNKSVVYLDPPYKGTFDYSKNNSGITKSIKEFLDWTYEISKQHPTFISEYNIEDNRFKLIDTYNKNCSTGGDGASHVIENLYTVK